MTEHSHSNGGRNWGSVSFLQIRTSEDGLGIEPGLRKGRQSLGALYQEDICFPLDFIYLFFFKIEACKQFSLQFQRIKPFLSTYFTQKLHSELHM